jgi:hypothetical protein
MYSEMDEEVLRQHLTAATVVGVFLPAIYLHIHNRGSIALFFKKINRYIVHKLLRKIQ